MRLLTQITRSYILFATAMLLLGVPVLYFTIRMVLINKLDDELLEHKNSFFHSLRLITSENDLNVYKHFYEEFSLTEIPYKIERDSIYTMAAYDSINGEITPYRVLRSGVYLHGKYYELIIRESLLTTQELIFIILLVKAGLLISLLTGLVLINQKITKNVFAPFYQIIRNLKKFKIDTNTSIPDVTTHIDEFRDLNKALIQLTRRNHQSYISQKEFTENAAHELQTPLAVIRTKLELLMQTTEINNDQAGLLGELYTATERINRLNKSLLLLSRIENIGPPELLPVNVKKIVETVVNQYHEIFSEKRINVVINGIETVCKTNDSLMEILVSNLVANAAKFTLPGGVFRIDITKTELVFSNSGLPLQNADKVFDRFHRESTQQQGVGLGLTICKQICHILGYYLRYSYSEEKHHFTLSISR